MQGKFHGEHVHVDVLCTIVQECMDRLWYVNWVGSEPGHLWTEWLLVNWVGPCNDIVQSCMCVQDDCMSIECGDIA